MLTYCDTVQKIKKNLIRKAQLKKSYNKIKSREPDLYHATSSNVTDLGKREDAAPAASLELHPERQAMLDDPEPQLLSTQLPSAGSERRQRWPRRTRPAPFKKEAELAQQRREEQKARQQAFEDAGREKKDKRDERERFRKAMLKARSGGKDGDQRKLGRESKVLLEKVQRMVQG